MVRILFNQCSFEIFFIDWEHEKEVLRKNLKGSKPDKYRGAWRQLNVANQFHELESYRNYSIFFAFSILVWAWYYLDWGNQTALSPNLKKSKYIPQHFILQYFIIGFVLILVGIGHNLLQFLCVYVVPLKTSEFVDLCCVANISVMILDDTFHGYYIHGQSPSGKSEDTLDALNEMLEEESEGKLKSRGLVNDDQYDSQTYEIYVSNDFREKYDKMFNLQSDDKPKRKVGVTEDEYKDVKKYFDKFRRFLSTTSKEEKISTVSNIKKLLNAELKERIVRVFAEPSRFVKNMGLMQRFFGMPSVEIVGKTREEIVFFKERIESFQNILLCGIEWELYV